MPELSFESFPTWLNVFFQRLTYSRLAPQGGNIFQYYAGTFEAIYVALHPFIQAISFDKVTFKPKTYPSRTNIVKNCKPVPWSEVDLKEQNNVTAQAHCNAFTP